MMSHLSGATTPSPKSKRWNCSPGLTLHEPIVSDLQIVISAVLRGCHSNGHQALPHQSTQACDALALQSLAKEKGGGGVVLGWKGRGEKGRFALGGQSAKAISGCSAVENFKTVIKPSTILRWKFQTMAVMQQGSGPGQTLPSHPCSALGHWCFQLMAGFHKGRACCLCCFGWHHLWAWAEIIRSSKRSSLLSSPAEKSPS